VAAYMISEVEPRDPVGWETYRSMAAKTIAQYGGRYLVRGGAAEAAEGGPPPKTLIMRRTALERRLIFVEGVAP
jgi:uncharacterized protein (DUF1330 family)